MPCFSTCLVAGNICDRVRVRTGVSFLGFEFVLCIRDSFYLRCNLMIVGLEKDRSDCMTKIRVFFGGGVLGSLWRVRARGL